MVQVRKVKIPGAQKPTRIHPKGGSKAVKIKIKIKR